MYYLFANISSAYLAMAVTALHCSYCTCYRARLLLPLRIGPHFENYSRWIYGSVSGMQEIVSHRSVTIAIHRVSWS
ncbi:uncharacterized protein BT62DRAFT_739045 [Guyanagaster necrorhizus]|uniref:Uncharacterized protein n=1 Tax=Guyanagaster necrorhizus TaxID=856835 RepID=A0A9P7VF40_9AGAR|nr:uncharacterized protein BT62DRAFT_739045 [Guyanagaster necrorhizus MCA 3950]KAG7439390.1 hypothetical protein BT62DRAFT_739045 [Guyanagaster necrorhizus MCA 3950]